MITILDNFLVCYNDIDNNNLKELLKLFKYEIGDYKDFYLWCWTFCF